MSITLRDFITFPFNGGKGIQADQIDSEFLKTAVKDATTSVLTITYQDSNNDEQTVELDPLNIAHHAGRGKPSTDPTVTGQASVDEEGQLWTSGDTVTTITSAPSFEHTALDQSGFTREYYRGQLSHESDIPENGDFQWNHLANTFVQRQGGTDTVDDWEGVWTYLEGLVDRVSVIFPLRFFLVLMIRLIWL